MNRDRLPRDVLYRKKQGFSVPLAQWLRQDLKDYVGDTLFGDGAQKEDVVLNKGYVRKLWDSHLKGINDHGSQIWNIFMFELWRRQFL